jgi:hypothetical protein|tara:strand:+ start:28820 stop:31897 length:3078 start_codon:yes stop_codon:yes gene_type:complete
MKRSKLILLGSLGAVAIAAVLIASPYAINKKGEYSKNQLSFLQENSINDDAAAWFAARYFDPSTGERITSAKLKLIDKAVKSMNNSKALPLTWEEKGPDNIGGRTRSIVIDKNNNNNIWAGSVTGGIFRSTNKGTNWSKVETYPGSKFISSMTQLQNGAIVAATGMSYAPWSEVWEGDGVWISTDDGVSWNIVANTNTAAFSQIREIVAAPNSNKIWLTTNSGLKSWTFGDATLTNVTTTSGASTAVQISNDGSVIVASIGAGKTFVSTDGGNSFNDKSGSGAGLVPIGAARMEYAISPTKNAQGKYNLYACRTTTATLIGMNVSQDNGETWSQFVGSSNTTGNLNIYSNQAGYNSVVAVDPTDPEKILIGGLDVWKWKQTSNNPIAGGFEKLSLWYANPGTSSVYVHADNHEFKFANDNRMYIGNDGGIGISTNLGTSFYASNRGYNVTQFYGMAFDKFGAVLGGAQDNGSLYNDYTLSTYKEFREVSGGDGVQCEISFFNPKVMFTTSQNGVVRRSIDKGVNTSAFLPDFQTSYTEANFPFHTTIGLFEYFDLNSKDSLDYGASKNYTAGSNVRIPSASTGDTINYVTPTAMYYDAFVSKKASLTQTRVSVKNQNGVTVLLGNYNYSYISGSPTLSIGDSLLVQVPNGPDTVVVSSIGSYKWYFAQHPISNKIIELGKDSTAQSVSWDSVRVADPFQSWFVLYVDKNGGELWGTRNALRTNTASPNWIIMAQGIGSGSGLKIDIEFSKNLNHCFISAGSSVYRIDGFGDLYTSDPAFPAENTIAPNNANKVQIASGAVEGIALNPNNPNDLIIFPGLANARRSSNATSASPTFTNLGSLSGVNSPFIYDGIIDRDDDQIIVVGTHTGVFVSANDGASWTYSSAGFEGTPVYEVRQSTRTFNEGNTRSGEIYIATFGRGIWASSSLLDVAKYNNSNNNDVLKAKLKTYPNPTAASTTLSFNLEQAGAVYVSVYSITGSKVKTIETKMSKGEGLLDIEANDLPRGTYIVKFTSGKQSETTKFIKL